MQIHEVLRALPLYGAGFDGYLLPENGIYVFYEEGETLDGYERIVRVGTHRVDRRLRQRLKSHYNGNSRGSVFRRHLGVALMEAGVVDKDLVAQLRLQGIKHPPVLEHAISQRLIDTFRFSVVEIDTVDIRLRIEAGLIASLARVSTSSESWLGRCSPSAEISSSGLWNKNHVSGESLSKADFELLRTKIQQG